MSRKRTDDTPVDLFSCIISIRPVSNILGFGRTLQYHIILSNFGLVTSTCKHISHSWITNYDDRFKTEYKKYYVSIKNTHEKSIQVCSHCSACIIHAMPFHTRCLWLVARYFSALKSLRDRFVFWYSSISFNKAQCLIKSLDRTCTVLHFFTSCLPLPFRSIRQVRRFDTSRS